VAWRGGLDHPIVGSGAGTFEILWYEKRPSALVVRDAHSLYAETFDELGIVGVVLLAVALLVPVVAAIRSRRSRLVAPVFGAYVAWVASWRGR
jgi:O-antigen ligase